MNICRVVPDQAGGGGGSMCDLVFGDGCPWPLRLFRRYLDITPVTCKFTQQHQQQQRLDYINE